MKFTTTALFFLLLLTFSFVKGQTTSIISGKIIEKSTKEPMEFVNVVLYRAIDSTIVTGTITDKNGDFSFAQVNEGNYYLQVSFIGFETVNTKIFFVTADSKIINEIIPIIPSGYVLGNVEVTEEKSVFETSLEKKVYNVGKDIMGTSGSASQILENTPSVTVDINGTISLRGSSNVTILINGRPSSLMRVNSAEALEQIPASTIERIEIITNTSAKYQPDGSTGIINIVLKKDNKEGFNGSINVQAGNEDRYNSMLSFNYKPEKINIFGSYAFRKDNRMRTSTDFRTTKDTTEKLTGNYDYTNFVNYRPKSHTVYLGLDYFINEKNTLGVSGNYFNQHFIRHEDATTSILNATQQITNAFSRNRLDDEYEWNKEITAYFEHKFKRIKQTLNFKLNLINHYKEEDNQFTQVSIYTPQIFFYENTLIRNRENAGEASIEYINPINENAQIEAGYTAAWINQDFDYFGEYFDINQNDWITDKNKSNRFKFEQLIHVVYLSYLQSYKNFNFELGIRGEDVSISSNLTTLDSTVLQNYIKPYPSIRFSYKISDKAQIYLSYRKRVKRPEGNELNPFPTYHDPRNLFTGNPYIKPEQIHSFELGYQFITNNYTFAPALFYRYQYDGFTEIIKYTDDSTLLHTLANLSREQYAGLEMIFSWRLKKIMTMNLSGSLFYNEIDASNLGYSNKKSAISGNLKLGTSFNITKSTVIQLNASYRSSVLTPQGKFLPGYSTNLGLRQDLFKGRASFLITVSDVFNSMRWESEIHTTLLDQKTTSKRKSQIIYFGFTYRFGKWIKKTVDELKFDEQK